MHKSQETYQKLYKNKGQLEKRDYLSSQLCLQVVKGAPGSQVSLVVT